MLPTSIGRRVILLSTSTRMAILPFHFISERGRRPYMEDTYVIPDIRGNFFAIFDGHGGNACSMHCAAIVKDLFFTLIERCEEQEIPEVLETVFSQLQAHLEEVHENSGTTATMIYITNDSIYTANVGDSDALLWRGSTLTKLTDTHRAGLESNETLKVERCNGKISGGRVNNALSVTRALGDFDFTPAVSYKPAITGTNLTDSDKYIIIATDGLWDAIHPYEIPDIVESADGDITHMCACLGERCPESKDNYTVGVIDLRPANTIGSTGGYTFSKMFRKDQMAAISVDVDEAESEGSIIAAERAQLNILTVKLW